jgi:hypothetical protein
MNITIQSHKIFINYRRDDVLGSGEDFFNLLTRFYGDIVFFDNPKIGAGEQIDEKIRANLKSCELFFILIGPNWDSEKYLLRLKDPNDYVRQEIELAHQDGKLIVPVLLNRKSPPDSSSLPANLQNGIFTRKAIKLDVEQHYWLDTLRFHHEDYRHKVSFAPKPLNDTALHPDHQKLAYCLNHDKAIKTVRSCKQQPLFMGFGPSDKELEYFVERCSINLDHTFIGILPNARVRYLSWDFDQLSQEEYQQNLYLQIAKALSINFGPQHTVDDLQQHIASLDVTQSYIFWAFHYGSGSSSQATRLWWQTWDHVLNDQARPNIAVFMFTEPSWLRRLRAHFSTKNAQYRYIGCFKGKIHKDYIGKWRRDFINVYLKNPAVPNQFDAKTLEHSLDDALKQEFPRLAFLRKSLRYDKAVEHLQSALRQAYQPNRS